MAETETTTTETTEAPAADFSFIPDTFKGEDGAYDTAGFRAQFDELASFKAQADEASAALPQSADDYAWAVTDEGFEFPEGWDASAFRIPVLDDKGEPVMENGVAKTRDMLPSDVLDQADPDLAELKALLHANKVSNDVMGGLAKILINRELRAMVESNKVANAEREKLGPNGQSRIDQMKRTVAQRLPKAQADALMNGITSADALRGLEVLFKTQPGAPVSPAPGQKPALYGMSSKELIAEGMRRQMNG